VKDIDNLHIIFSLGPNIKLFDNYPLPSNCEVFSFVPQLEIMPLLDIFFSHGGNNGINEALYYGVSLLVMPFFGDQPVVARVVVQNKLGRAFMHDEPTETEQGLLFRDPVRASFTGDLVREAVVDLLSDPTYSMNAKAMSEIYHNKPDISQVCSRIMKFFSERDL